MTTRIAGLVASMLVQLGCAHAGSRPASRPEPEEPATSPSATAAPTVEPSAAGVPADQAPAAEPRAPAPSSEPGEGAAAIEADHAAPAPRSAAARTPPGEPGDTPHPPGAGRNRGTGAVAGMAIVVKAWGVLCLAGGPLTVAVCLVGFPFYWPYALGAVALGATVGAAVGGPEPSARRPRPAASQAPAQPVGRWSGEAPAGQAPPRRPAAEPRPDAEWVSPPSPAAEPAAVPTG